MYVKAVSAETAEGLLQGGGRVCPGTYMSGNAETSAVVELSQANKFDCHPSRKGAAF